jgi:uncharacterized membrane protein
MEALTSETPADAAVPRTVADPAAAAAVPADAVGPAAPAVRRPTGWLVAQLVAALIAMGATVVQLVERIAIAENPDATLSCDLNGTFSCGSVITAWQSSVFGAIPNAVIGFGVMTVMATAAAGALLGTRWSRPSFGVLAFLGAFMAAFTVWFLQQTAFVIERVCLWCLVIGGALLVVNVALWRVGVLWGLLAGESRLERGARWLVRGGTDLVLWGGLAALVAVMMVAGLTGA